MIGFNRSPIRVAGPDGGDLSTMARPVCRDALFRTAQRIFSLCIQVVAIPIIAANLVNVAHAQFDLPPPVQEPPRTPGSPTPSYPLVKPGLPPPGLGISRPTQPPAVPFSAPATVHVRQSKTHPNGVTILIDTVSFLPSSIVVSVEIFNPAFYRQRLNPSGSLLLTDERGRSYFFVAPVDNPELVIGPQSHVFGQLLFLGGVDWQARALRLTINHPFGSSTDRMTVVPLFQFSLPAEPRS
ncbi:hypothetical protein AB4Z01_19315 [Inquilinus sp. YAF38]|uniref:hypothetical protein n=1 Tax=Inquilinus sp. YAF38 TaxID=3233084 RepID=UPI003F8F5340